MTSPFPGMNPYLEDAALWPKFHHELVTCLYQIILTGLVDRYCARFEQRQYMVDGTVSPLEDHIAIQSRAEGSLVTLVDVVSLANKTTESGRQAYLATRQTDGTRSIGTWPSMNYDAYGETSLPRANEVSHANSRLDSRSTRKVSPLSPELAR